MDESNKISITKFPPQAILLISTAIIRYLDNFIRTLLESTVILFNQLVAKNNIRKQIVELWENPFHRAFFKVLSVSADMCNWISNIRNIWWMNELSLSASSQTAVLKVALRYFWSSCYCELFSTKYLRSFCGI